MRDKREPVVSSLQPPSFERNGPTATEGTNYSDTCHSIMTNKHNKRPPEEGMSPYSSSSDAEDTGTDSGVGISEDTPCLYDGRDAFSMFPDSDVCDDSTETQYILIQEGGMEDIDNDESLDDEANPERTVVYVITDDADISNEEAQDLALQVLANGYSPTDEQFCALEKGDIIDPVADPVEFNDVVEVEIPYVNSPVLCLTSCVSPSSDTCSRSSTPTDFLPPEDEGCSKTDQESKEISVVVEEISYDMPVIKKEILQQETSRDVFEPVSKSDILPFIDRLGEESCLMSKNIKAPKAQKRKLPKQKKVKSESVKVATPTSGDDHQIHDNLQINVNGIPTKKKPKPKPKEKTIKTKKIETGEFASVKTECEETDGSPVKRASDMLHIRAQHPVLSSMLNLTQDNKTADPGLLHNSPHEDETINPSAKKAKRKKQSKPKENGAEKEVPNGKRKLSVEKGEESEVVLGSSGPGLTSCGISLHLPVWPSLSDGKKSQSPCQGTPNQDSNTSQDSAPPKKKKRQRKSKPKCSVQEDLAHSTSEPIIWQEGLARRLQEIARQHANRELMSEKQKRQDQATEEAHPLDSTHSDTILPKLEPSFLPQSSVSANIGPSNRTPAPALSSSTVDKPRAKRSSRKKSKDLAQTVFDPTMYSPANLAASLFNSMTQQERNEVTLQQVVDACISDEMNSGDTITAIQPQSQIVAGQVGKNTEFKKSTNSVTKGTIVSAKNCDSITDMTAGPASVPQISAGLEHDLIESSPKKLVGNISDACMMVSSVAFTASFTSSSARFSPATTSIYTSSPMTPSNASRAALTSPAPLAGLPGFSSIPRPALPPTILPGPLPRPIPSVNLAMTNSPKKKESPLMNHVHASLQPSSSILPVSSLASFHGAPVVPPADPIKKALFPQPSSHVIPIPSVLLPPSATSSSSSLNATQALSQQAVPTMDVHSRKSLHTTVGMSAVSPAWSTVESTSASPVRLPHADSATRPSTTKQHRPQAPTSLPLTQHPHTLQPLRSIGHRLPIGTALPSTQPRPHQPPATPTQSTFDNYTYKTLQMFLARNVPFRFPMTNPLSNTNTPPSRATQKKASKPKQPAEWYTSKGPAISQQHDHPAQGSLPSNAPTVSVQRPSITSTKALTTHLPTEDRSNVDYIANWKMGQTFCCCYCAFACESGPFLFHHWLADHNEESPAYGCAHCPFRATHNAGVVNHMQTVHAKAEKKDVVVNRKVEEAAIKQFEEIFGIELDRAQLYSGQQLVAFLHNTPSLKTPGHLVPVSANASMPSVKTAKHNAEVLQPMTSLPSQTIPHPVKVTETHNHTPAKPVLPSMGSFQRPMFPSKSAVPSGGECESPLKAYLMSRMNAAPGSALPHYDDILANRSVNKSVAATLTSSVSSQNVLNKFTLHNSLAGVDKAGKFEGSSRRPAVGGPSERMPSSDNSPGNQWITKPVMASPISLSSHIPSTSKGPASVHVASCTQKSAVDVNCNKAETCGKLAFKPATFVPSKTTPSRDSSSNGPLKANWQPIDKTPKVSSLYTASTDRQQAMSRGGDSGKSQATSTNINDLTRKS